MSYCEIELSKLVVSECNVRRDLTDGCEIEALAEDMRQNGLINAICVRKACDKYEIYAGQRRFLAAKLLKWDKITCKVDNTLTDIKAEEISLAENIQRVKMTIADKCKTYNRLYILNGKDIHSVAKKVNLTSVTVQQYITINNGLHAKLFSQLDAKGADKITLELAVELAKRIPKDSQVEAMANISHLTSTKDKVLAIKGYDKTNAALNESVITVSTVTKKVYVIPGKLGEDIIIPPKLYSTILDMIEL